MRDRGTLILLVLSLAVLGLYFGYYGFSESIWTRYGQYAGIAMVVYFTIDEFFKE